MDRSEIDFRTDDGMKRGEILFKELMMMIEGKCQQQMAQQDLDMSLDLQNAKRILQVNLIVAPVMCVAAEGLAFGGNCSAF